MEKTLVLFAHPALEKSKANRALIEGVENLNGVTFHDLYETYPDFHIDVEHEKELLLQHDHVIWHHPLYWYSVPALFKQWFDLVLEYGWAYGNGGNALSGKKVTSVITTGGSQEAYGPAGQNLYSIN
jgi:glutathione-regulated potassium-efflux system ancillary protein KefG